MIRTDKRMRLCCCLITALLIFIWGNSLMPGWISQSISDWLAGLLLGTKPVGGEMAAGSGILRKLAHFTEFAALGMCFAWLHGMLKKGKFRPFLWGVLAAAVDETIQRFVPQRHGCLTDVGIDTAGVITGIVLFMIVYHINKKQHLEEMK